MVTATMNHTLPSSVLVEVKIEALYCTEALVSICERTVPLYRLKWYLHDRRREEEICALKLLKAGLKFIHRHLNFGSRVRDTACYELEASLERLMNFGGRWWRVVTYCPPHLHSSGGLHVSCPLAK